MNQSSKPTAGYQNTADDDLPKLIVDVVTIYIFPFCCFPGVVSNVFNMAIFCRLGLKDGMSVNLFSLSLADFLTTYLQSAIFFCCLIDKLYPLSHVDVLFLGYYFFRWIMNNMYLTSCWITAVITLERCFCVVFPFKVKMIFTRFRSVIVILIIYALHIGLCVPMLMLYRMEWVEIYAASPKNNNITESPTRVFTIPAALKMTQARYIFDITVNLSLLYLSFSIILACTVWMINKLQATSKIRHTAARKSSEAYTHRSQLSTKERKLVKVSLGLAVSLSVCGLPRVVTIGIQSAIAHRYTVLPRFLTIMWAFSDCCSSLGCSITFVVYLVLNKSFRAVCVSDFPSIKK